MRRVYSTVLLMFEPGRVHCCDDLVRNQQRPDVTSRYSFPSGPPSGRSRHPAAKASAASWHERSLHPPRLLGQALLPGLGDYQ
jgi:hypothetical protein